MHSNKIQTIILEDDVIEILYNTRLSKNPYLIRMINYYGVQYEIRANEKDMIELCTIFNKIVNENSRDRLDNADIV